MDESNSEQQHSHADTAIAVVGMACHLPGASNIDAYWENLRNGVESVKFFSEEELLAAGEAAQKIKHPQYVPAQPALEHFDMFDAKFWGFSPQDAAVTDPAHRRFLEVAYHALEHAGHTGYDDEGTVGVFAASGASQYLMDNLKSHKSLMDEMGDFLVRHTGNDMNFLATRLSYELDLRGPSINIQTACSSALVAIHSAIQSLLGGECDTVIAGGSTILLPQQRGYMYREGEIMSPDGHCRPFDEKSKGTIFGSGAGAVVLRCLDDAIASGDTIYAVIRGTGVNNDGARKIGFLAPSVDGQIGAIAEALEIAEVDAQEVSYVEAHGTGTQVGDPIEFTALQQVFGANNPTSNYCRLGSVKANIGHLGEAAGIASFIKVVLALHHEEIPPIINFSAPNTAIDVENSAFKFNSKPTPWPGGGEKRIAGINALGAGGTNAHVILEEAPAQILSSASPNACHLLVLSGKTANAVSAAATKLAKALEKNPRCSLADVAYTLQFGRRTYLHRQVVAAQTTQEAIDRLQNLTPLTTAQAVANEKPPNIVFMFPGGGAQFPAMGAELYEKEAIYRDAFDSCLACIDIELAEDLRELLGPKAESGSDIAERLERPSRSLPALFATEYALAQLFLSWGVQPTSLMGHSMGEYTAACVAGVFSAAEGMQLVVKRGQLFETLADGAMLSISSAHTEVAQWLTADINIAAINADELCVAAGPVVSIDALQQTLESNEINCTRVRINVAAHSAMLEPILQPFREFCQSIQFNPPTIPLTSNLTGGWLSAEQACDAEYWVNHLRNTVQFNKNLQTVLSEDTQVLIEFGPGRALSSCAKLQSNAPLTCINAMRNAGDPVSDLDVAHGALGHLWASGGAINWSSYWHNYGGTATRKRVPLPGYAFERKAYWVNQLQEVTSVSSEPLAKRANVEKWFARLSWEQSRCSVEAEPVATHWLIFEDAFGVADEIILRLAGAKSITRVKQGSRFKELGGDRFEANPIDFGSIQNVFDQIGRQNIESVKVIYLWTLQTSGQQDSSMRLQAYDKNFDDYFTALLSLSKCLINFDEKVNLLVLTSNMQSIHSAGNPEQALISGAIQTLPHETEQVRARSVDIDSNALRPQELPLTARNIINEMCSEKAEQIIAYRGIDRWVQKIVSDEVKGKVEPLWLSKGSTVLISGGLGGIGLTIAVELARLGAKHLVLLAKSKFPERELWSDWLEAHADSDLTAKRIIAIQEIERLETRVTVCAADITDYEATRRALKQNSVDIKSIDGVIHAAGRMDDQLIQEKSLASSKSVIDVKVMGALVLDEIFARQELEFFIVFSSVASFLGLPGQIDYTAANAFLDAFARERRFRCNGVSLAINWNAWQQVGMAENARGESTGAPVSAEKKNVDHTFIESVQILANQNTLFSRWFNCEDWILSEHKTKQGVALIPGTGFIELLRAAFTEHCSQKSDSPLRFLPVEISNVQFADAFALPTENSEKKLLQLEVRDTDVGSRLQIFSDNVDAPNVLAQCSLLEESPPASVELERLRSQMPRKVAISKRSLDQDFMDFGPRWACIDSIIHNEQEALIALSLSTEFTPDLEAMHWHPALMDMAIGGAQFLIKDFAKAEDFYVPIGYTSIRLYAPNTATVYSYVRLNEDTSGDLAFFDVEIFDEHGGYVAQIKGFTMKKVAADFSQSLLQSLPAANHRQHTLDAVLRDAITPAEGIDVFNRAMSQPEQAQWIISSVDPDQWKKQLESNASSEAPNDLSFIVEDSHDPDADPDISSVQQCLLDHAAVAEIVVRSFLNEIGERRLIAFYVSDWDNMATVSDLRQYASEQLDSELVPQQFIEIEEFHFADDGKLVTDDLKDPFAKEENYLKPESATEIALAKIWQTVLKIEKIGLSDNFFDLGGHSLLAIRAIVRCEKEFGVALDQAVMIMHTLEQISAIIDEQTGGAQQTENTGAADRMGENTESQNKPGRKSFIKSLLGDR